jgi:hypothetical protein
VRLYIIPVLNPDGDKLDSRQNANGVDLNRNMNTNLDKCSQNDWSQQVFGAYAVISNTGEPYADSEPESRVIRAFLLDASAVVFLHSSAGLVFPSVCDDPIAIAIAQTYAKAGNYQYARYWDKYPITGGMHDWRCRLICRRSFLSSRVVMILNSTGIWQGSMQYSPIHLPCSRR